MNNDATFDFEERVYVKPEVSRDEQMRFVDTLRDVNADNTAQINTNTYALGSQVPSNVGGLSGTERMWQAQFQTPQIESQIANVRASAQADALKQAQQNLSDIWTKRYKDALDDYYRRAKAKEDAGSDDGKNGDLALKPIDEVKDATSEWEGPSTMGPGTMVSAEDKDHYTVTDIKYGVPIDNPQGLNVNQIINQIESQGHQVTNKRLSVDKDGFLTLNIKNKDGSDDSISINMKGNLTNRGY